MSGQIQQRRVFLIAVALTFLLGGAYGGGVWMDKRWRGRLADPQYLKSLASAGQPAAPAAPAAAGAPAALVRVDKARLEEICPEKPVVGRLAEVRKVTVASEIEGKIVAMNVSEGSPVVGGKTVIASIDRVWLDLAVAKQKARIEVNKAQVRKEKDNLGRLTALSERGVAPDRDHADQLAAYEQKQAELKESEVALQEFEEQLSRVDIVAPFDGWVILRHAELGQRLSRGSPVVDIVSRGDIYAVMNVPESLVNDLKIGMKIPVTIEPLGETRAGELCSITPYGAKASRTYPVRVLLPDEGGKLKAGMSVTAIFPAAARQRQLMVSRDAVLTKPDGETVWVVREGQPLTAVPAPVEVVARVGDRLAASPVSDEARALLVDGATVVIEGAERLRPNQPVTIMEEKSTGPQAPGAAASNAASKAAAAPKPDAAPKQGQ